MAGSLHSVRSKEALTAEFPTTVHPITGEINLKGLIRLWQHIKSCAQQTETNYDHQNWLFCVLPQPLWPYFSARPYPAPPQNPGPNPSYNHGQDGLHNTTIRETWQLDNKYYEEHKHMNAAMRDRFLKLLPEANRSAYVDGHLTANPKMNFRQVFDYFWEQFGIATEEEIVDNIATLLNPWQPNEGLEVLIDRFDKAQIYAFFAKSQMDDKTLINPFLILIKKTGKYIRAYEDWIAKPDADKTYVNMKEFWRVEHLKMKRTNPSASTYRYGMNATA